MSEESTTYTFRLSTYLKTKLMEYCEARERDPSDLVRELIKNKVLDNPGPTWDRLSQIADEAIELAKGYKADATKLKAERNLALATWGDLILYTALAPLAQKGESPEKIKELLQMITKDIEEKMPRLQALLARELKIEEIYKNAKP